MKNFFEVIPHTGLKLATKKMVAEILHFFSHLTGLLKARKYKDQNEIKLHLGCGSNIKSGWLNVDLRDKADLRIDIREKLPFTTGSCSIVYSEHVLEHMDYPEPVKSIISECYRILKQNGVFSCSVPDHELVIKAYVFGGDEKYEESIKRYHPDWIRTKMEHLNYNLRMDGGHKFAYDYETMKYLLEKCGFKNVKRREFNPELDTPYREYGSLFIEATKP